ncbi:putative ribonuclease H-like domain-containing protein [Tanacetum coccineum]
MYPEPVEEEVKPLYSRFVKAGEMHAVPPSITGTYMPIPYKSDIEETQVSYGSKSDNKTSETLSESNDFVSCDNSDKSSDSETYASCDSSLKTKTKDFPPAVDIKTLPESDVEDPNSTAGSPSFSCLENVKSPRIFCNKSGMNNRNVCKNNSVRVKKCFVCGSKLHLIKDCDFYNCVDSVPCKSKAASVPAGSRNSPASVTAGGSDPAASRNRPAVNSADRPNPADWSKRPATVSAGRPVSAGWLNPAARPYFRPSSVYSNNKTNFYDPMFMYKGRWDTAGDPSTDNDIGIVDSGCSRSMTGNKEKLDDFVQIKGGIVKFGGGDGRISGKGTIRTSKLDFENVYYVEELQHFNLFSVSQICDKKNKVLFTDTDCLVLSEEFQLPDESQVVLRIPREHDLYTFHISDLQPEQKVTCLVAKASLDESTRWHRRMAHVNFKTINKLARKGIKRDYSNPRTPQQNGVAERKNRTLIEAARTMLADSKLPTILCKIKELAKLQDKSMKLRTQRQTIWVILAVWIDFAGDILRAIRKNSFGSVPASQQSTLPPTPGQVLGLNRVKTLQRFLPVPSDVSPAVEGESAVSRSFNKKGETFNSSLKFMWMHHHWVNNKSWCMNLRGVDKGEFEMTSRTYISLQFSACSRHQVTPLTSHLNAVKKIFKYLKGQPKLGLWYPKDSPFQLEAYSDSDYAWFHGDQKSTQVDVNFWADGGYVFCGILFFTVISRVNTAARTIGSAGSTMIFACSYPFCLTLVSCWSYYDLLLSFLLDALFLLVAMDYAADSVYMLSGMCSALDDFFPPPPPLTAAEYIHAAGVIYAAITSIHAAGLLDIAGWLVSATSHLVSAGSLHSCWCNNVSAA